MEKWIDLGHIYRQTGLNPMEEIKTRLRASGRL